MVRQHSFAAVGGNERRVVEFVSCVDGATGFGAADLEPLSDLERILDVALDLDLDLLLDRRLEGARPWDLCVLVVRLRDLRERADPDFECSGSEVELLFGRRRAVDA